MRRLLPLTLLAALAAAGGCLSVKTENEIKPIHITMDVNLKVDKELDRDFANESAPHSKGDFAAVKAMLERQAAGMGADGFFVAREGATDDDRILIAETNARRTKRYAEIARSSGVTSAAVGKRSAKKFTERLTDGCGVWYQGEDGGWRRK